MKTLNQMHFLAMTMIGIAWFSYVNMGCAADNGLPVDVQADILFSKAKDCLDDGRPADAVKALAAAGKLDVPMPDDYYYHYGRALLGVGENQRAVSEWTTYLLKGAVDVLSRTRRA